ncbi:hypothetical protein PA08_0268 [Cutibacterium modestum P08]|nr:hypothetical protein PA08_0268 [Cutibacterium modestum P08]
MSLASLNGWIVAKTEMVFLLPAISQFGSYFGNKMMLFHDASG